MCEISKNLHRYTSDFRALSRSQFSIDCCRRTGASESHVSLFQPQSYVLASQSAPKLYHPNAILAPTGVHCAALYNPIICDYHDWVKARCFPMLGRLRTSHPDGRGDVICIGFVFAICFCFVLPLYSSRTLKEERKVIVNLLSSLILRKQGFTRLGDTLTYPLHYYGSRIDISA